MTKEQVKEAARRIFSMRVAKYARPSPDDLNKRRIVVKKKLEDRRYSSMLAALAPDEPVAG